jgi:type VI secretion system ImpH/TssG family protein
MLSPRCKIEDYNVEELTFAELVKFVELFEFDATTSRIIQFKTYLDGLVSHKGLVEIKQDFSPKFVNRSSYKYTVFSNILALLGPSAILPAHYTERAVALLKEDDRSMIDFIDIFYNKLMYSLYRILRGTDTVLNFQVYALRNNEKLPYVVRQIASFIGIRDGIKDLSSMLRYSGVVAVQNRSASVLQGMICAFINEAVFIDQFALVKVPLTKQQRSQIGKSNCSLSQSLYCGSNAYLYQNKISIKIKNLNRQSYKKLIAQKRDKNSPLNKLISNYLGRGLTYDLELRVKENEKSTRLHFLALGVDLWCSNLNKTYVG